MDRIALAMHARASRTTKIPLHLIDIPTLVIAGDADPLAQRPQILADAIPGAQCLVIAGVHGCITNPEFPRAVTDFLTR